MISASAVTARLEHPGSPIRQAIADPLLRRLIIGVAMELTAIAIIYSPWDKQSGAHINPVVTFAFFRLGKIKPWDAVFYIVAQFTGGLLRLLVVSGILRDAIAHPAVNYVVTTPGSGGLGIAFLAELIIANTLRVGDRLIERMQN